MEKLFEKLGDRLSNFFTRSVAPSSVFFILLFFNDMYFNNSNIYNQFVCYITKINTINPVLLYIILVVIFLAYGYINQILSQLLDNFIKSDYSVIDDEFKKLRIKLKESLSLKEKELFKILEFNDYNAYQVLGNKIKTSFSYVDDVKSIHSLILAINLNILIFWFLSNFWVEVEWLFCLICIAIILLIGNMIAKMRYKARNKRMYINYLIDKNSINIKKHEIKYIKVNR